MNAVHGRAGTDDGIKTEDELVGMLFSQTMHQVDFGGNGPLAPSRRFLDLLDDIFGRAIVVSGGDDFTTAFGMNQDVDAAIFSTGFFYLLNIKAHMRGTIAL